MNMTKPVVGIVLKPIKMPEGHLWHRFTLIDDLRFLVVENGGIAIGILPTEARLEFNQKDDVMQGKLSDEEVRALDQELQLCQGLILQGGLASNYYEIALAKLALARDMPLLGTCAGFNNLLRAAGGKMIYDETGKHNFDNEEFRHKVLLREGTRLAGIIGEKEIWTNSIHKMVATEETVTPNVKISAMCEDGTVEGIEVPGKRFAIGVKWHPEILREDEATKKLFAEFMRTVREYAQASQRISVNKIR